MAWWFGSDWHWWHSRIIELSNRPFNSVEEMNEHLIKVWNELVAYDDDVCMAGDISFGDANQTEAILRRLNGKKYLVKGNHDNEYNVLSEQCLKYFVWVKDRAEIKLKDPNTASKERIIIVSHEPKLTWAGGYKIDKKGQYRYLHAHGHCHSSINHLNKDTTREDIGVDNIPNYALLSEEQLLARYKNRTYMVVDHHGKNNKK